MKTKLTCFIVTVVALVLAGCGSYPSYQARQPGSTAKVAQAAPEQAR